MAVHIHVGCCGWSYLNEHDFENLYSKPRGSKLQAYAQLFGAVEINSTYYRIPRVSTVEKWRAEADALNLEFEFTVKAYQGITHLHRFRGKESLDQFAQLRELCRILRTHLLLFQSPASFKPSDGNIAAMQEFFAAVVRDDLQCVWEPRGLWSDNPGLVTEVCERCQLIHCVDPFRNDLALHTPATYFRLHGFGKPSIYRYSFSEEELGRLWSLVEALPSNVADVYLFFNNVDCYRNARQFMTKIQ